MNIVTLPDRKARMAARKAAAAKAVIERLRAHVLASGSNGRFIVFGSAASGAIRHGSDFDVIIDFPPDGERAAWDAVEDACREYDIREDIKSAATTAPEFIAKVLSSAVEVIR